jgi:hypothetical protein
MPSGRGTPYPAQALTFVDAGQENAMRVIATIALALVTSAGLAAAQSSLPVTPERPSESLSPPPLTTPSSQLQLTTAHKAAILDAVRQESGKVAPPGTDFVASIGGPVPPQLELYVLPDRALATVPAAKTVKYTLVHNQIVLVDPTTMRVVDIIQQ